MWHWPPLAPPSPRRVISCRRPSSSSPPHSSLLLLQQRLRMLDSGSRHLRASTTRLPATPPRTNSPWLRFSAQCPYSRRRITSGTSPQMLLLTCLPVPISSHIFLPHGILLLSLLLSVTDPCSPLQPLVIQSSLHLCILIMFWFLHNLLRILFLFASSLPIIISYIAA